MDRNIKKNGLVNFLALLAGAAVTYGASRQANSQSDDAAIVLMATGVLVAAFSYFQMRLLDRERLEKLELDELAKTKTGTALFVQDAESFPARHARQQFEKWVVPGFTIVLLAAQGYFAWWLWKGLSKPHEPIGQPTLVMTFYGLVALVLFFLGKYSSGLARLEGQQLLRPGASYLSLGAYLIGLATISIAAAGFDFPRVDYYLARALCVILTLVAVENLMNLILEVYRPRRKGEQARVLYDSRLIGMLSQPEEFFTTAAQALDYQFGFKVSETEFYRSVQKRLPAIIWLQVGVLLLSTCVVFIDPAEEALLERFGKPVESRPALGPGVHFKLPWPIDAVHRFRTQEIQNMQIGFVPDPDKEKEKTILWTVAHYKEEFNLLVASREPVSKTEGGDQKAVPASLLTVSIPVQYKISDVKKWALVNNNSDKLLEKLATREVVRYLVSVDLNEIMSSGRQTAALALQKQIQARADEFKLGVTVLFVGLQDIHPPTTVAESYQAVVGALQEKEAKIHSAQGYRAYTNALGQARAHRITREAQAYQVKRVADASAQAARFTNQISAFASSPSVYPQRAYFQSLSVALSGTNGPRKYIVIPTNTTDVIQLNLEDKVRMDLLDVPLTPANK